MHEKYNTYIRTYKSTI